MPQWYCPFDAGNYYDWCCAMPSGTTPPRYRYHIRRPTLAITMPRRYAHWCDPLIGTMTMFVFIANAIRVVVDDCCCGTRNLFGIQPDVAIDWPTSCYIIPLISKCWLHLLMMLMLLCCITTNICCRLMPSFCPSCLCVTNWHYARYLMTVKRATLMTAYDC